MRPPEEGRRTRGGRTVYSSREPGTGSSRVAGGQVLFQGGHPHVLPEDAGPREWATRTGPLPWT
ncbi:hypothetical protein GCM10010300_50750 [Streptomyces olivaceoviridis]|nr:hypothetical protein GCM10010300_50750 [Streptomyces olivaceoviridis]